MDRDTVLEVDGIPCRSSLLYAGSLIRIREWQFIVESARTIALGDYLSRLLGWSRDGRIAVDSALRTLLRAHQDGTPVLIRGDGELTGIVRGLHDRMVGPQAPLVACRRTGYHKKTAHGVMGVLAKRPGLIAYRDASQGTLMLSAHELPDDLPAVLTEARSTPGRVLVLVVAGLTGPYTSPSTLTIPPIGDRMPERDLIIVDYLEEATDELGLRRGAWRLSDLDWMEQFCARTHAEIQEGAQHVLAIAASASMDEAASRLATDVDGLAKWLREKTGEDPSAHRWGQQIECGVRDAGKGGAP